jgi:quaternary ammonium compound-resistance protein SugE
MFFFNIKDFMNWIILILAGLFEIGWPLGLKMSQTMPNKFAGILIAVVSMGLSGLLLWTAQKTIPIGTAYAVWTGIGAAGTFIQGIIIYDDSADLWRIVSASFIVIGIVGLKSTH